MAQKMFVHVAKKATFTPALQTTYADSIVFIKDSQEIFTHGVFYAIPDTYKTKITNLESAVAALESAQTALKYFSKVSDGTNVASAAAGESTINFAGTNGASATVSAAGVSIDAPAISEAAANGAVKVTTKAGAVEVPVHGLKSAAYTEAAAYGTAGDVATAKSDITTLKTDVAANKSAADNHAANKANPHAVTKAQVGLGSVENKTVAEILANASLTGVPTAPTAATGINTEQVASAKFVHAVVNEKIAELSAALVFRGTIGAGGTVTVLPASHKIGDVYIASVAGTYAGEACEIGDMIICVKAGTVTADGDWTIVQTNINGAVTATATLVANQLVLGDGSKAVKNLAPGSNGQVLKMVGGVPTWSTDINTDTTYAFANGADGSFSVTPSGGSAQKVLIGKPASAGTADKVVNALTVSLNGTAQTPFTGASAVNVNVTPAAIGAAPASHTHTGLEVSLAGYVKGSSEALIVTSDTVSAALAKLENRVDLLDWAEL